VGTQQDTSRRAVEMAEAYEDGVYAMVGLHPVHTDASYHDEKEFGPEQKGFTTRGEVFDTDYYRKLAGSEKVVAIGECGLDYYRISPETKEKQDAAFIAQIELANEVGKPLMLHIRPSDDPSAPNAYEDAYAIIKKYAKVRGNAHFFAGTVEDAKKFWDVGYSVSFTGVITFTCDYDEVVQAAPKELIHAETDAPYVTPVPYRGKRNEPLHVREVYKRIAQIRGEDEAALRAQLRTNAQHMYGIAL